MSMATSALAEAYVMRKHHQEKMKKTTITTKDSILDDDDHVISSTIGCFPTLFKKIHPSSHSNVVVSDSTLRFSLRCSFVQPRSYNQGKADSVRPSFLSPYYHTISFLAYPGDGRILDHRPALVAQSIGSYRAHLADGSKYSIASLPHVTTVGVLLSSKVVLIPKAKPDTVSEIPDHPLILTPEFGPGVTPGARLTRVVYSCAGITSCCMAGILQGPTSDPTTPVNRIDTNDPNNPPNLQEQILGRVSSLKALVQLHNESPTGSVKPIWLSFDDEGRPEEKIEEPGDLRKPYKEVLRGNGKCPYGVRCFSKPWTDQLRDGSTACPMDASTIGRICERRSWKERWTEEMSYIPDVLIVMHISSFMSNSKCPKLARRFSDQVPKTVTEMMNREDDFVKSEEVFKNTELPRGGFPEKGTTTQFRGSRPPRHSYGSGPSRTDIHPRRDHYQPYVSPRAPDRRYDNRRHDHRRQEVNHLRLDSLTKLPSEILAMELQLQLPPCPPTVAPPKKENLDRYCEYHDEKGHYTKDCFHLKKQLEVALESGKLNHLIKDVRQRGNNRGRLAGNNNGRGNVINMSRPKLKDIGYEEYSWINAAVQVMFEHCFDHLSPNIKARLTPTQTELVGFSGEQLIPIGKIELEVQFNVSSIEGGSYLEKDDEVHGSFFCTRIPLLTTSYSDARAYIETMSGYLFHVPAISLSFHRQKEIRHLVKIIKQEATKEKAEKHKAPEGEEKVLVNPAFPEQAITIGSQFSAECRELLIRLLKDNMDVFAWQPSDMTRIPKLLIRHTLNVNNSVSPVVQKRRVLATEKSRVVTKEVEEWVKAGIVRPVKYPTWISNPVLVKKVDGTWRMCIDFKNLNVTCPKDYYPLPEIDLKIEAVMGHPFKCFLDAYKGYHQVQMSEEDKEKTAFYTDQGTYCYVKMPFGLKNAGATYQRLVDSAFQAQLGRNLEAYVDDMVIKSKTEQDMIMDIAETFDNLRKINMKLNPMKCSFGVAEGKFLGYIVTSKGIRANPKKTKAIADMQSPKTLKEMQSLSGKLAALNRFLSRSAKRSLPFFETLKNITKENKDEYKWTEKAKLAFQELKRLILELPMLATPERKEALYVYLAESRKAVITDQPIKQILNKPEVLEKLAKYAVKLGAYSITYIPRTTVKGQVLADFINEVPVGTRQLESFKPRGVGAGLVLIDPSGTEYTYAIRLTFPSINNKAEYEALLAGLRIARKMKVQVLNVKVDLKLVACQMNGEFVASNEGMAKYLAKAKEQAASFKKFSIKNIPRNQNQKADVLSKLDSVAFNHLTKEILFEVLNAKSVDVEEVSAIVEEEGRNWMTPIIECLEKGIWPNDENEARSLRMKISQYVMEDGVLFKKSYLFPMLRCVGPLQANYIIREVHEGACEMHAGARSVVAKIMRQGYY
ncbi:reverse transcriptase domain-containing protein [Tanacetum coccineum]